MSEDFLDDRKDAEPFYCDVDKVSEFLKEIDETKNAINEYFKGHPSAKERIYNSDMIVREITQQALSYMFFDDSDDTIGIKPSAILDEQQKKVDQEKLRIALAYRDACRFILEEANKPNAWLSDDIIIKAHNKLYEGIDRGTGIAYWRFREGDDLTPDVFGAPFNAVPSYQVNRRMLNLYKMMNYDWWDDHAIVRASKFLVEYFRIQPHVDGNKRTGLLCLNFLLESNGYLGVYINGEKKEEFLKALNSAVVTRNVTDLVKIVAENEIERQKSVVEAIKEDRMNRLEESLTKDDQPN